jgi:Chemotaxis signal transduction protein
MLNNEEYGIEIRYAREILRIPEHMMHLPNMPFYVEGIINIRGTVIPIIDLKKRFNLPQMDRGSDSRLLILDLEDTTLAVIVDDVSEIMNIEESDIQTLNSVICQIGQNSLSRVANLNKQRLILLLNVANFKTDIFTYNTEMEEEK